MSQPPMDEDFLDRIQRILNEKKKEDLRKQHGMLFEGHSEEMSPQMEGEWLDYITEFERQFENARQITVRERLGSPDVKPLTQVSDSELAAELERILELLDQNNVAVDFIHEQDDREMYRFITEELLDETTDDIRIPGMSSDFIYEEFYPNDEDDITQALDEFLYALFKEELKEREDMSYYIVSQENMHDSRGEPVSLEEFKALVKDFYEAYPFITDHGFEIKNLAIRGDDADVQAQIGWHGIPNDEKAIVRNEGISNFKLARSPYGGRDIVQAGIPGWEFRKK